MYAECQTSSPDERHSTKSITLSLIHLLYLSGSFPDRIFIHAFQVWNPILIKYLSQAVWILMVSV